MSDDQIIKPTNVHVTGGELADIETKNVHVTGGEDASDAIAEKIGIKNVHVTGEPADAAAAPLGNVHVTTEPAK
ncbi:MULTISPECIES: hypothetical protein [unclassified Streptomyces]|uniref:hypothetical protein n=1 Tax=unclassified Streptomyces TaxID=2593676 RepID=UPI0036305401